MIALLLARHRYYGRNGGSRLRPEARNRQLLIRDGGSSPWERTTPFPRMPTRINAAGNVDHPGAHRRDGQLGRVEISAVPGTREATVQGDHHRRGVHVQRDQPGLDPHPRHPDEGITTAARGAAGNLVSGQRSSSTSTAHDRADAREVPVGIVRTCRSVPKRMPRGSRRPWRIGYGACSAMRSEYERAARSISPRADAATAASAQDLEALLPVLHGRVALIATHRRSDIRDRLAARERSSR